MKERNKNGKIKNKIKNKKNKRGARSLAGEERAQAHGGMSPM